MLAHLGYFTDFQMMMCCKKLLRALQGFRLIAAHVRHVDPAHDEGKGFTTIVPNNFFVRVMNSGYVGCDGNPVLSHSTQTKASRTPTYLGSRGRCIMQ